MARTSQSYIAGQGAKPQLAIYRTRKQFFFGNLVYLMMCNVNSEDLSDVACTCIHQRVVHTQVAQHILLVVVKLS
jgi:hypothetical protein